MKKGNRYCNLLYTLIKKFDILNIIDNNNLDILCSRLSLINGSLQKCYSIIFNRGLSRNQAINHLKSLVLTWSDQIDVSLRYSQAEHAKYTCDNSSSNDEDLSVDHLLKSPIFELEYWRHRTQVRKYIFFLNF